jgi:hypothetical protein
LEGRTNNQLIIKGENKQTNKKNKKTKKQKKQQNKNKHEIGNGYTFQSFLAAAAEKLVLLLLLPKKLD